MAIGSVRGFFVPIQASNLMSGLDFMVGVTFFAVAAARMDF
jgi:hypothetical protein